MRLTPARAGFVALAGLAALGTVAHAWSLSWSPDGLPTWDSAGYLLQAAKIRDDVLGFDGWGLGKELTHPDLHPPLHSALLGLWLLPAGDALAASRVYAAVAFVVGLGVVAALGRRLHPTGGWEVGAGAALLAALGVGSLELVSTPMTEATTLPVQYAVLTLMVAHAHRTDARARLLVGVGILVATLVRYNLGPMLAAPLFLHHALRFGPGARTPEGRRALFDPTTLLWVAPLLLTFAGWQLLRPELFDNIRTFLQNRSSGIPFWSVENLAWVPLTLERAYLGTWLAVAPLGLLFLWGLRPGATATAEPARAEGLRVLQSYVVVGFAALTAHDFKIERNLGPVLPAFYLCGLAALAWGAPAALRRAWAPVVGLVLLGGPLVAWQNLREVPVLATRGDFRPDPTLREALEFIERHARARERTWVVGWVFRLSPNLIDFWLRSAGTPTKLFLDQPVFGAQSRTGVDAAWSEQYATYVADKMLADDTRGRTTYITISTAPGTRYFDEWKAYGNNYARAFAEQTRIPEVDRLSVPDRGLLIRVYREGDAPSAESVAATATGVRPEDDAGVRLPAAEPLYRDTLRSGGASWLVYPPDAVDRVRITREDGAVVVAVDRAEPQLQLCDPPRPLPARAVRAVVNLRAEGLTGNAWLHFRGMDDRDQLQKKADGAPDITQAGPVTGDGAAVVDRAVAPVDTSTRLRTCVILDQVTGRVRLEDYALFPADAPALPAAIAAPGEVVARPEDDAGVELPAGEVVARETFTTAEGWQLRPPEAGSLTRTGSGLGVVIGAAAPSVQLCGPSVPWTGPATAVLHADLALTGRGWFHLRALDAGGVLLKDASGVARIVQMGPLTGDGRHRSEAALDFGADARMVRPCLVLDGATGTVTLDDLAFVR